MLYVSGEESPGQIKLPRAPPQPGGRDEVDAAGDEVDAVLVQAEAQPALQALIVDSIQTAHVADLNSAAGSVSQVRECAARLQRWAKQKRTPVLLVGHVTKEGAIAGPRCSNTSWTQSSSGRRPLPHLSSAAEREKSFRRHLREVGVFEMREEAAWPKSPIPRRPSWQSEWSTCPARRSPSPWRGPGRCS